MPSELPKVVLVSEMPAAAPAFLGGADATTKSIPSVTVMPHPADMKTLEVMRRASEVVVSRYSRAVPVASMNRPPVIMAPLLKYVSPAGASIHNMMLPPAAGNIHRPA